MTLNGTELAGVAGSSSFTSASTSHSMSCSQHTVKVVEVVVVVWSMGG
jgi:hypothetical protein